jgi:hypothetical protein
LEVSTIWAAGISGENQAEETGPNGEKSSAGARLLGSIRRIPSTGLSATKCNPLSPPTIAVIATAAEDKEKHKNNQNS